MGRFGCMILYSLFFILFSFNGTFHHFSLLQPQQKYLIELTGRKEYDDSHMEQLQGGQSTSQEKNQSGNGGVRSAQYMLCG